MDFRDKVRHLRSEKGILLRYPQEGEEFLADEVVQSVA
jgi:hypothetical protein